MPYNTTDYQEAPKDRYEIDTVLLAEDLRDESVNYLITIEDHFSKFLWATTSKTKDAKSVEYTLKTFFTLCGFPKVLQSDNGKEIINKRLEDYLKSNNVEYRHGRPYYPQSPGLIERANRTIQTALTRIYHQKKDDFNIKSDLVDVLSEYNNNVHTTIQMTPMAAFKLTLN